MQRASLQRMGCRRAGTWFGVGLGLGLGLGVGLGPGLGIGIGLLRVNGVAVGQAPRGQPPAVLIGFEARGVAEEELAVEGAVRT